MSGYDNDTRVRVHPFQRRVEGDSVTIGDPARQVYLSLPVEALLILDCLAEGKTVGETQDVFAASYGETPDMEDFLGALASEGFVALADEGDEPPSLVEQNLAADPRPRWLTQRRCRRLCGTPAGALVVAAIVAAVTMLASDPGLLPGPSSLVFTRASAQLLLGVSAFFLASVAVHEVAHLVVARAVGVPARIRLGHRLWMVVAETDMTGIWMAPKWDRYRAFLAGSLVDMASASVCIALLWAHQRAGLAISALTEQFVSACLFLYLLRLLWQCFVFVRTDFYFVIATALGCKNLLEDTSDYLRSRMGALLQREEWVIDQSDVPAAEMRVIRSYAVVYILGRVAAFAVLVLVTLPVMSRYVVGIAPMLVGRRSQYGVLGAVVVGILSVATFAAGLVMWVRSLVQKMRGRKLDAVSRPALQNG